MKYRLPTRTARTRWLSVVLLVASSQFGLWLRPTAEAQEPTDRGPAKPTRLEIHGDWTTYVIEDRGLRLCFAETEPMAPAGGALPADTPALLLTHRAARGPAMVRLAMDDDRTYELMAGAESVGRFQLYYGTIVMGPQSSAVEELLSSEASGLALKLRDANDEDVALARYSSQGLRDAYKAIRHACPERESPNDVRVRGEVVRVQPHVEIGFTGPFAEAGSNERFSVRIYPSQPVDEEDWPEDRLASFAVGDGRFPDLRNVDRVEHLRGEELLGEPSGPTYLLDFWGVCLDPGSGRIRTLFESWSGSASTPSRISTRGFDPERGLVANTLADTETAPISLDCSSGEALWGELFRPCSCSAGYERRRDELVESIREAVTESESEGEVGEEAFSNLLARIDELLPFLYWDAHAHLEVDKFSSSEYSIVVLTYFSQASYWSSFQHMFVRRPTEHSWGHLYDAPMSSRYFGAAEVHRFVGEGILELEMCTDYCASRVRVELDVERWIQAVGRKGDDYVDTALVRAKAAADAARRAAEGR